MLSKIMTVIQRGGGQALRKPKIGAIFVEFAVAIPVLIAIVYYLHDVPKYKRMQAKMSFCAHCMANILQNVSNGQKVTLQHINHAMQAAYLTFYPGKTMRGTAQFYMPLGHFPHGFVYCVKGISGKKASVVWDVAFFLYQSSLLNNDKSIDNICQK
jgi:hypothetical protein